MVIYPAIDQGNDIMVMITIKMTGYHRINY